MPQHNRRSFNDGEDYSDLGDIIGKGRNRKEGGKSKPSFGSKTMRKPGRNSKFASSTGKNQEGERLRFEDLQKGGKKGPGNGGLNEKSSKKKDEEHVNWREKHAEKLMKKQELRRQADHGKVRNGVVEFTKRSEFDGDDGDDDFSRDKNHGKKLTLEQLKKNPAMKRFNDNDDDNDNNDDNHDNDDNDDVNREMKRSDASDNDDNTDDAEEDSRHRSNPFSNSSTMDDDGSMRVKTKKKSGGFQSMNLYPQVFQGIMRLGFRFPTPIQRQAIPVMLEGRDVVAMARTGSGKTAAFAIPLLHFLQSHDYGTQGHGLLGGPRTSGASWARAVVLSPTGELAVQTHKVICQLGRFTDLRMCLLIGGQTLQSQFEQLSRSPDIIVATPGRLVHHFVEVKFTLPHCRICVFDEADRLFEMGFAIQIGEITKRLADDRMTWLFSATMPKILVEFTRAGLKEPVSIRLDAENKLSPLLGVSMVVIRPHERLASLIYLLECVIPSREQAIVFCATKRVVDLVYEVLVNARIHACYVHSKMDIEARKIAVEGFRGRKIRV